MFDAAEAERFHHSFVFLSHHTSESHFGGVMSVGRTQSGEDSIVVHSKLMQNYKPEAPVSATSNFAVVAGATGLPVVLSVSSNNMVYAIEQDASSVTRWKQVSTGFSAAAVVAGVDGGKLTIVAIDGSSLKFTVQDAATGMWSSSQPIAGGAPGSISCIKLTPLQGSLFLTVFFQSPHCATAPPYAVRYGPWAGAATDIGSLPQLPQLVDSFAAEPAAVGNGNTVAVPVTPQIYSRYTSNYDSTEIYVSDGSGTPMRLGIWRAIPPDGYSPVGHVALGGDKYDYSIPESPALTVTSVEAPDTTPRLLSNPESYTQVWNDRYSGAKEDGATWRAVRDGYTPLGDVGTRGYGRPSPGEMMMVRSDLVNAATNYDPDSGCDDDLTDEQCNQLLIYANVADNDISANPAGHGKPEPVAIDAIRADSDGIAAGTFYSHESWGAPAPGTAFALSRNARAKTTLAWMTSEGARASGTYSAVPMNAIASSIDARGEVAFFGIGSDACVYYATTTGEWTRVASGNFVALAASVDALGRPEAFLIAADRTLYHVRQETSGAWGKPQSLDNSHQWAGVGCTRDADSNSSAFGVTAHDELFWFFQDTTSSTGTIEEVELEATGVIQEMRTYTSEINVSDFAGGPRQRYDVTIWSDDTTVATVNRETFLLDAARRVRVTTDGAGKLSVVVETTSLYAPVLRLATGAMLTGESISIEPNFAIQEQLKKVDGKTLTAQLGTPTDKAEEAARSIQAAMSLTTKSSSTRAPKYLGRNHSLGGLHYHASAAEPRVGLIDFAAAGPQNWIVRLDKDGPHFHEYPVAAMAAHFASVQSTTPDAGGAFDWVDDLGDLVVAAAEGIADELSIAVQTVANGIEAVATFVIDGIRYHFDITIRAIEQAFDIVQAVFDSIAATFEQLVAWLGFLFNWADIVRTKEAIKHMVLETLPLIKTAAARLKQRADQGINALQAQLAEGVDQLITTILGGPDGSLTSIERGLVKPKAMDQAAGTNIVLDAFQADTGGPKSPSFARFGGEIPPAVAALISALEQQGDAEGPFQGSPAFADAVTYLQGIGSQPDQFLQLALSGLLKALEGIADIALDVARALVDVLCDAVGALIEFLLDLLREPWEIPFVSELYINYISPGSALSALDLFALIVAIPATVIYKAVVKGKGAPFADEAALASFKSSYTTKWLLGMAGLGPKTALATVGGNGFRPFLCIFCGVVNVGASVLYGMTEFICDIVPINAPTSAKPPEAWGQAALAASFVMFVSMLPWADPSNDEGLGCNGIALGNTLWLTTGWIAPTLDTGMYLYSKLTTNQHGLLMRNFDDASVGIDVVWGMLAGLAIPGILFLKGGLKGYSLAQAFILGMPAVAKVFRLSKCGGKDWRVLAVVGTVDGLCDILGGAFGFVAATLAADSGREAERYTGVPFRSPATT
jgi:hypothetical protein